MDNKRKIGEEELKRALLMMKYDSKKTLTENVQEVGKPQILNEWGFLLPALGRLGASLLGKKAATTAAGTAVKRGLGARAAGFAIDTAAFTLLTSWISSLMGGGDAEQKLKMFFEGCPTHMGKIQGTNSQEEIRKAADTIWENSEGEDWYEGFGSGNEENIKKAIKSMNTISDICALSGVFYDVYGTTLEDALTGEATGSDLVSYVWVPINDKVKESDSQLSELQQQNAQDDATGETQDGGTGEVQNAPAIGSYTPCSGTYTRGCYSEAIKEVQTCLGGLVPDGKFGPKTQAALDGVGFGSGFKDSDVSTICNVSSMPEPDMDLPTPDEDDIDSLNI
jgi:hypothetical protein